MQANTEYDGRVLRLILVGLGHGLLELDGSAKRIDGAAELNQGAVTGQLDQPTAMPSQCRLQTLLPVLPQARDRATLVPPIRRE